VIVFAVLLGAGAIIGLVLQSLWLGLLLGLIVALVWLIGFESRRGGKDGVYDDDDDGAVL